MERIGFVAGSVSVVVVAYHSRPDLELCLPSIFRQSHQPHEVIVVDKGRGVGGRMATRRVPSLSGEATFDHGAQFFTVRDDAFAARRASL